MLSFVEYVYTTGISEKYRFLYEFDEVKSAKFMRHYCTTPFSPGEQIESASPHDISFWPIHPTMDRLYHYKRIVTGFNSTKLENTNGGSTTYCNLGGELSR